MIRPPQYQLKPSSAASDVYKSKLEISDVFMDRLVSVGFDPVYGARPLRRAIQQELENPLAQRILAGDLQPGDIIAVDFEEGQSSFTVLKK